MSKLLLQTLLILASYFCFTLYTLKGYAYFQRILTPARDEKTGRLVSLAVNYLVLSFVLFCNLPVCISLIVVYFVVMLQFLYLFRGDLIVFLFSSGIFLFHIMNVKLAVTSTFILAYDLPSYAALQASGHFPSCTLVTALLLLISIEVFRRVIDFEMIQPLMRNKGQLQFVTSSMMLINVYLLILSVSYGGQLYSAFAPIFLLSTSVLLFGAFYTSFCHAIKMSVLMENEARSKKLEAQLRATEEDVAELQVAAFTDTLTAVHNRRYGLDELNRYVRDQIPFCLCFLDIDHLKYVNDTYGHEVGDRYILDVVEVVSGACLKGETFSRIGGDEFLILMPRLSRAAALERLTGAAQAVSRIPSVYHPSVSFGLVEVKAGAGLSAAQILRQADREMYLYKQSHRSGAAAPV